MALSLHLLKPGDLKMVKTKAFRLMQDVIKKFKFRDSEPEFFLKEVECNWDEILH